MSPAETQNLSARADLRLNLKTIPPHDLSKNCIFRQKSKVIELCEFLELSVEILHGFMSQRDLFISGVFCCYSTFGGMIYTHIHASQMCFDPKMTENQPKSMDLVDFDVF